jgi:hypothetical protein
LEKEKEGFRMRLLHFAQSVFLSLAYADDRSSVQAWRERALSATLFVIVFIGTLGYVFFLITDIVRGFQDRSYWAELPVDTIGYLILLGLASLAITPAAVERNPRRCRMGANGTRDFAGHRGRDRGDR